MTIAQWKGWELDEENFMDRILDSFDPNFTKDLPFLKLVFYINRKLTSSSTPFSSRERFSLSKEQKSAIRQRVEDDQGEPYYKEVMGFFDEYLGEKGEGDYGVKELAKIDDRAKEKVDRAIETTVGAGERREGRKLVGTLSPDAQPLRLYFFWERSELIERRKLCWIGAQADFVHVVLMYLKLLIHCLKLPDVQESNDDD